MAMNDEVFGERLYGTVLLLCHITLWLVWMLTLHHGIPDHLEASVYLYHT